LVEYGGIGSGTTISLGGEQYVDYGGTASGTTISSGGVEVVDDGPRTTTLPTWSRSPIRSPRVRPPVEPADLEVVVAGE
jgi:autotransporter passenger strand-loop-strand repeat protein